MNGIGVSSDVRFIQRSCIDLNGASIVADGVWGPATETAYTNLKNKLMDGSCGDPKTSSFAYQVLCGQIARTGYANLSAGGIGKSYCA